MQEDHELNALTQALDGRFIRPVPGGDLMRNPDILPTGRNMHGFDPCRLPSAFAMRAARCRPSRCWNATGRIRRAARVHRHRALGHGQPQERRRPDCPGTAPDGRPPAHRQLRPPGRRRTADPGGTRPPAHRCGDDPHGIFRDLLPAQTQLLAEAAYLAAVADEPVEQNFVRAHALAYQ